MSLPSSKSTMWFSRSTPLVRVVMKEPPALVGLCPCAAEPRLSLPSHSGCRTGSAMSSKISEADAAISISALTTLRAGSIVSKIEASEALAPSPEADELDVGSVMGFRLFAGVRFR